MNRSDHAVIGVLVVLLAVIALAIGMPAFAPTAAAPSPTPTLPPVPAYREGMIGRPVSVNPLAARTQVDRDLVALAFGGLVRLGPDESIVPDLASRWTTDETGKAWTFTLRQDARWHDGRPVTSADVVFTVNVLRDATYAGPGAGSWREVTAVAVDSRTVRFDLATPLGGFLSLATQPIAPAHLLGTVPIESLADDPFGRTPVGSGPFVVVELDDAHAVLEPAATATEPDASPSAAVVDQPEPTDALATPAPTKRPSVALPGLSRLEFRFFEDPAGLTAAFESGELDAASGLAAADAQALGATSGARLLRYPGTTLTTIVLNLRPDHPELRDPSVRAALLVAIDRPAIIDSAFNGLAAQAESPIPPSSWAFDSAASPATVPSPVTATNTLTKAGWTRVDERLRPAGAKEAYTIRLVVPDAASNAVLHAVAEKVAADWDAIGLSVELVDSEPGAFLADLQDGKFTAAALDVSIGHDPDLYPLLAASQTQTGGLNVMGLQDATLDGLLAVARRPGTDEARKAAYTALQTQLATGRYVLPIAFADEVVVVRDAVQGVAVGPVADPSDRFWDVLTWRLASDR
ncbi:MAG TPA: peptide ABC transporter substrate-binding protein [Candidatus Limnocylindrales bacterium]|nr:peptide ABC transporter substrate-binding protein [Candidatus Limnocylindrales bacterium]